jgi:hypothetical protein
MFHFQNLKQKFGRFSYFGNYVNSVQIINLAKHDIFPHFQKYIMKTGRTNLLINSGKLMVNMQKYDNNLKTFNQKTLFAENNILYETDKENDLVLTNKKYILTIAPNVFYSFYSYDDNTNFQLFYKSDDSIRYYTYETNNKYFMSSIEYLN